MYLKILILIVYLSNSEEKFVPRILGGKTCETKGFPYVAIIRGKSICQGSLITLNWVLTAAHCVAISEIQHGDTAIIIGWHYKDSFVQVRLAKLGIQHPKFNISSLLQIKHDLRYDIGLILATKPFDQADFLIFPKFPTPGFTKNCTFATAIGFVTNPSTLKPQFKNRNLTCVNLPIIDKETCLKTWVNSFIDNSIICTMERRGGKDACHGDSGGPLVCRGVMIGIISAGIGCARPNTSATNTKVEAYLDWINYNLGTHHFEENQFFSNCEQNNIDSQMIKILLSTTVALMLFE